MSGRLDVLKRVVEVGIDHRTEAWAARAKDRFHAEQQVHDALAMHRVVGLNGYGRECYIAPLGEVLAAIRDATGEEPVKIWERRSGV